jgi:cell wall-associated NlpC family hydrolase
LTVRTLFPRLLVIGFAISLTAGIAAQTNDPDGRPRYALSNNAPKSKVQVSEPALDVEELDERAPLSSAAESSRQPFEVKLLSAIESHLGASYHFNTTGPDTFDCSGLVWRAFNDIGINFQRGPARSYWAAFEAPQENEKFKFGTLVFFSGLRHVGIVADEKGFYHSSRHYGVIYSPFNDYWLSRIDGFRRVPLEGLPAIAREKTRQTKPASIQVSDEGEPR